MTLLTSFGFGAPNSRWGLTKVGHEASIMSRVFSITLVRGRCGDPYHALHREAHEQDSPMWNTTYMTLLTQSSGFALLQHPLGRKDHCCAKNSPCWPWTGVWKKSWVWCRCLVAGFLAWGCKGTLKPPSIAPVSLLPCFTPGVYRNRPCV